MSNRDVAPRLRALDERVTELEGVEEQLVEIYIALDGLPFSEMVEGRPYAKHLNAVEQIKRLRADLVSARAEHQRTESELNQAQLDKRRAEDDRDEWERHLHIERREHQKAIEERDKARAEVAAEERERKHYYALSLKHAQSNERLKRVMEDAASAPGIDWLFWQLELGKALNEETP